MGPGNPIERGDFTADLDRAHRRRGRPPTGRTGALIDVRAPERYAGRTEPMDSRAGHIPGAINLPTGSFLDDRGRFLPAEQIRQMFADIGVTDGKDAAIYCGSGIHATHALAAMEIAGLEACRLYPGSWSQWSADRSRPIALGENPR